MSSYDDEWPLTPARSASRSAWAARRWMIGQRITIIFSERMATGPDTSCAGMFRAPLRPDLHAGALGPFVCVSTRVERVQQGQLRVIDDVDRVVEGIGCILLGPVGISGRGLGV
jgi:hypothetical protein